MFISDLKILETNLALNTTQSKKIEIDENLTCFIIIDSNNWKIITPLLNKIVDFILDNIDLKDTYNKFSITLESINFFIKTLKTKENEINELNIIIWILEKNNFHFAKVWKASCFLVNYKNEVLELSDRNATSHIFDYISSWRLSYWEKVIISNISIWETLTESDLLDISKLDTPEKINQNIKHILDEEKYETNVWVISIKFENENIIKTDSEFFIKTKQIFYKSIDNNLSKKTYALYLILKEKIEAKWKIVKNFIFFSWILISSVLLYIIISWVVWKTIESWKNNEYKNNLIQAREYIRVANQNITNPEAFNLNIKKAEEIINTVKDQKLFLNDVESIVSDISIIKKQFNWVEIFESNTNNLIFKWEFKDSIKLLELNKKLYVIWKTIIYWPIITWQNIKNNLFNELAIDDEFTDAVSTWEDIVLTTKKSRVVRFTKDWNFKYINVLWQSSWEWSEIVETYNWNIYMTNKEATQIYKHTPSLWAYTLWTQYLNEQDKKNIGKILSLWIDWWIYLLDNELKLLKFFSSPKYRLESIILNKLPDTYKYDWWKVNLITRINLNYIYLFLNNKIWIFEPNTKIFSDTKSLTYRWQIEWKNEIIKWFYVPRDWEIDILTENGIHKINFEIKIEKDWSKLIVR